MRLQYDEKVDALYVRLDESEIVESEEIKPGVVVDFNRENQIVAIEVRNLKRWKPPAR